MTTTGRISLSQWSEAMEAVTNFKLPWRLLREKLAVANANNEILYANTLQMIELDDLEIVSLIVKLRLQLISLSFSPFSCTENCCQWN
jgi:hypothetical protein